MAETKNMIVNMGPQHPATHGVLRVVLELDGEIVVKATPHLGHLHRGLEKLGETNTYHQALTLTDRMDYTGALLNNLGYCLTVEKLLGIEDQIPPRAHVLRVCLCELQRIAGHLLWLASHALDIGAMTVLFYAFRERETIHDILEEVTGARLTPSFVRVGGLAADVPPVFFEKVRAFVKEFPGRVDEYEGLLTQNKIWRSRTEGIGIISKEECVQYSLTGPVLRAAGIKWDLRKVQPYCGYDTYDFEVPTGTVGDVYERYLVRLAEMRQSIRIVSQALERLASTPGPVMADIACVTPPPKQEVYENIDALIRHFKLMSAGFKTPEGDVYMSIEATKGELGYYIVSDGSEKPYRLRVRPPCFINLQSIEKMIVGRMVADVIAVIGSLDIVLGEIDR
ncbi:MAG: NADH dehydrogenase (quinone) subunit D [Deltaproteobacteria bacterium]|nr:NADH dehydrogenase (quinone) subunit D [Deltaproteobacteria bacterium]